MAITIEQLLSMLSVDAVTASISANRLVLLQRDPQPDEEDILVSSPVRFLIVDLDSDPTVSPPPSLNFTVKIEGVTVGTYSGGVFTPVAPWGGSVTTIHPSGPYVGWQVELTQTTPPLFMSEQLVNVEVDVALTGGFGYGPYGHFPYSHPPAPTLTSFVYEFTAEDLTPPKLLSAEDKSSEVARVTFDDSMAVSGTGSVLDPDAWSVTTLNVDPWPGVSLEVVSVAEVDGTNATQFDLTFEWEQTPGCLYELDVATTVEDTSGNQMDPTSLTAQFTGFSPEHPKGRRFDIWSMMVPKKNRLEDETQDLRRWINCFQEVLNLLLIEIDRFTDQFDPDLCADEQIDAMLYDMGNPFDWAELELTPIQRRKLLRYLIEIYKLKGTDPGIENAIFFLLGEPVSVVDYTADGWRLGIDELGTGEIAQVMSDAWEDYDFSGAPLSLEVKIDSAIQVVTFQLSDFAVPSAGKAAEVSAVLDTNLSGGGSYVAVPGAPAVLVSGNSEAYAISGGDTLTMIVGGMPRTVTFHASDFVVAGSGTAAEVAARVEADVPELVAFDVLGVVELQTVVRGELA
ncbi:MAG: hypothetical protein PVJ28_08050, partial [Acidimicrobiia bacterium]